MLAGVHNQEGCAVHPKHQSTQGHSQKRETPRYQHMSPSQNQTSTTRLCKPVPLGLLLQETVPRPVASLLLVRVKVQVSAIRVPVVVDVGPRVQAALSVYERVSGFPMLKVLVVVSERGLIAVAVLV